MKKILLACILALCAPFSFGQSYPSPTYNNLTVNGIFTATGKVTNADLATQVANTVLANATGSIASPTAVALPSCSTTSSALNYISGTGFTCNVAINASQLLGFTWNSPGTIGATTPNSGVFTTLTANTGAAVANGLTVSSGGESVSGGLIVSTGGIGVTGASNFNNTVTGPTSPIGTNNTNLATTAFVSNRGPCANIVDFGGDPTNTNNNDTAFSNAASSASNTANQECVFFPPGIYKFASQIGKTFSASHQTFTIRGSGVDTTMLQWASNGGIGFNYKDCTNNTHISDLTVGAGTTNTGVGITLTNSSSSTQSCSQSTINNVTVRGDDNYFGTNYFSVGVSVNGVSDVNYDGLSVIGPSTALGSGLLIQGVVGSYLSIVHNIANSTFDNLNVGLTYGTNVQGVQIVNSNFTNDNYGIQIPASEVNLDQLSISNSQFNALAGGYNILEQSAISNLIIMGNTFLINNNSSGVNMQQAGLTTIIGNTFSPNTGSPSNVYGVIINGWTVGGTEITGNNYYNLTAGNDLQSGSKNVNVQSNVYQSCVTNNPNAGVGNVIGGGSP